MFLLDTDVVIDIMRNHAPVVEWLRELGAEELSLSGLVAMELLQGYWPTQSDSSRAYDSFSKFHLSDGIGILDALIAETAVGLKSPLATFNEKHYRVISDLDLIQPYSRN